MDSVLKNHLCERGDIEEIIKRWLDVKVNITLYIEKTGYGMNG